MNSADFVEADVYILLECNSMYSASGDVRAVCYTVDDCLEFLNRLPTKTMLTNAALLERHTEPTEWQKTSYESRAGIDIMLRIERRWVNDINRPDQTIRATDVYLILRARIHDLTSSFC